MPGEPVRRTPLQVEMTLKEEGSGASLAPRGGSLTHANSHPGALCFSTGTAVLAVRLPGKTPLCLLFPEPWVEIPCLTAVCL